MRIQGTLVIYHVLHSGTKSLTVPVARTDLERSDVGSCYHESGALDGGNWSWDKSRNRKKKRWRGVGCGGVGVRERKKENTTVPNVAEANIVHRVVKPNFSTVGKRCLQINRINKNPFPNFPKTLSNIAHSFPLQVLLKICIVFGCKNLTNLCLIFFLTAINFFR